MLSAQRVTRGLALAGMIGLGACSPTYQEVVTPSAPAIAQDAAEAFAQQGLDGAQAGYLLIDQDSGEILSAFHADKALIPASTAKLLTAVAALEVLGPGHRFVTKLCQAGDHLYLVGGGDPDLDIGDLAEMADDAAGFLASVEMPASFIIDDSLAPREYVSADQPKSAYYNPEVGALTIRDALVYIHWQPEGGNAVSLYQSPDTGLTEVPTDWLLELPSGSKGDARYPVKDPGLHAGAVFQQLAVAQGLELPEPVRGNAPDKECQEIARHESAPMIDLVENMLETSSNIQAELIGLAVSRALGDQPANLAQSSARLRDWWAQKVSGMDWSGMALNNHSGLDSEGRMTARQMLAVLEYVARKPALKRAFFPRLAVSGWKGWLKDRLDRPETALRVWAKTGTMNYGVALAGRFFGQSERPVLFAVFVSDLEERSVADVGGQNAVPAGQWNQKAKASIDSLMRSWLQNY
ncbi:D-alanyl-D-alanine carboxypeptidase/D-alanyl-D-alanine-endopeptidase [Aestuariispira insulae]|uniref:D-alanyl-D-alanine carboxypeptidase/D-alanyl-D-alanine-endopeptidase (Penicillin-binding protein 4) n=1 Tax=Aestuariispira insulae TaxID=1461337 RepID=A0A3D9HWW0_9PROT|nr:D-alanyl-D-alanine carboxypeptidase [Aestuariispira insulae]RED53871.1 D-alanyl-D-alanine carboxypeptidase/D-alanyl-D-alanine-endopeptidase (penicillin-binding protein 4) [Aestuariispira insulae]